MEKMIVGVADCYLRDVSNGDLLAVGKSLIDSSIESSLSSVDVRGGRGNPLRYVYFHSPELKITLTDAQWNLALLAKNVGSSVNAGNDVFMKETITVSGGAGSVVGTPLSVYGALYGWCEYTDIATNNTTYEKITFSTKAFNTSLVTAGKVNVYYYAANAGSNQITLSANMIPSIVDLVMEAQLCSKDSSTNKIGTVQIRINRCSLTGGFNLQMKSDSVSSTPLNARAFPHTDAAGNSVLGTITEIYDSQNWYDDVIGISVENGDPTLASRTGTKQLVVRAIHSNGAVGICPVADLDFTSGTGATATIGLHTGLIQGVTQGTTLITAKITAKTSITTAVTCTVP
jgi:hypothetical protein